MCLNENPKTSEILGIYIYYLENNNAMEDKAMMRKETKLARSRQLTSINKNKKDGLWRARVQLSLKNRPSGERVHATQIFIFIVIVITLLGFLYFILFYTYVLASMECNVVCFSPFIFWVSFGYVKVNSWIVLISMNVEPLSLVVLLLFLLFLIWPARLIWHSSCFHLLSIIVSFSFSLLFHHFGFFSWWLNSLGVALHSDFVL